MSTQVEPGLPRLLAGMPEHGAMRLERHLEIHGQLPVGDGRRRRTTHALIDQLEQATLGGRGGAGFSAARKMRAVASAGGVTRRPIVVVNASEGEPASLKDRTLLETLPHLVLDGAALAARAIGAQETLLCVCESSPVALERARRAIDERTDMPGDWPSTTLVSVPEGYVAGQESALVNHLNGGPAIPTFSPPLPHERGVRGRPTLVNNAETLAHVALIARHGAHWFCELGLASQPGSALVTLRGPLAYPGVYEMEYGVSLSSLVDAAGGLAGARVRAALIGGYGGTWLDASVLAGLTLSDEHLAPHEASLGAGVVLLLSEQACPIAETARVARWLARQSAGQCGPCVHGLGAIAETLESASYGGRDVNCAVRIERLAELVYGRGACRHPDGVARFVTSAVNVFAVELADHLRHGTCTACTRTPELPLPTRTRAGAAA